MAEQRMMVERITRNEIDSYKREIMEQSVLLTPKDAAAMLSCSPRTVLSLVHDGKIRGYSRNGHSRTLRVLASELKDYVRSIQVDQEHWRQ